MFEVMHVNWPGIDDDLRLVFAVFSVSSRFLRTETERDPPSFHVQYAAGRFGIGVYLLKAGDVTEKRTGRTPEQQHVVRQEATELGETRKGAYFQAEVGLPPGFVPPSAALTPPPVEQVTARPANGQQNIQQASSQEG